MIPESQCITWCNQGATANAKSTHESIRNALLAVSSEVRGKDIEVFLQGSYRNDTNIRGDSDVDVVVELKEIFRSDTSELPPDQAQLYKAAFSDATYTWHDLDRDVQKALKSYFGNDQVVVRNKCITIKSKPGRLNGDVVTALQYRRYRRFRGTHDQQFVEGIVFLGRTDGQTIINFPKPHYENGVTKNALTGQNYKPSVRMIKNARTLLRDRGVISNEIAPSYFVEGFLFNIPNNQYVNSRSDTFYKVLKWLEDNKNWSGFTCQNGELPLFGSSREQWDLSKAQVLHGALVSLWNNWK